MNTKTSSLIFAIVMVFSSFVGCIETDDEKTDTITSPSSLGNVIVSTYHVAELVRGVGGDRVTVEIISPSNVPVHDYAPSAADLIRLQDVDLFFYHGLNLEPWVDATISSLGSDAPLAVQTHAMPTGENTLDYQSMLLSEICETLNDDAFEAVTLADHHDEAGDVEIHAEAMTHKVSYPEMDDDHDDHGDDHDEHGDDHDEHGDDHDDHGDDHDDHGDDHNEHGDDHDDHAEHNHAMAEKVISNPANCPSDTVVSVFHLEEGEYLLEFEYGAATEFDMVVLKMMGGHAHHDHHGHGDEHDDHDDNETHDDHDDNETHDDHDGHDDHGDEHDDHGDNHDDHGDDHHEEMTDLMAIFNSSDADGDGFLNLTELEHFIPAVDEYDDDDHDDHDGHDDNETHDDDHDDHDGHDDNETHDDDHDGNETHDDDHDDHDGNETHDDDIEGDDVPTPQDVLNFFDANNDSLLSFDEFWHAWEEEDDDDHDDHHVAFATLHVEEEGDYGFALPSGIEYFILMGEGGHDDHDDHGDDHSDHSDGEDHSDEENNSDEGSEIVADEDEEAFDYDPHSWLSPVAYKAQVDVVLNALITAFPDGEADFKANAEAYSAELDKLDLDYTAAFGEGGTCEASNTEKTIVANHNAYAYIAERYDIEILTVHGLDPEGEPSAADIVEVVEQIEENNITTLYVEEYTDTSSVDSIVQQTGVTIEILYTMELPPKNSEDTYLTLMSKNLDSLVEGMGC